MDEFAHCAVCDRTPLVGEEVTVMLRERRETVVCGQCAAKPRAAALGEPSRRERIRSAAGAANVSRIIAAPVPAQAPAPVGISR